MDFNPKKQVWIRNQGIAEGWSGTSIFLVWANNFPIHTSALWSAICDMITICMPRSGVNLESRQRFANVTSCFCIPRSRSVSMVCISSRLNNRVESIAKYRHRKSEIWELGIRGPHARPQVQPDPYMVWGLCKNLTLFKFTFLRTFPDWQVLQPDAMLCFVGFACAAQLQQNVLNLLIPHTCKTFKHNTNICRESDEIQVMFLIMLVEYPDYHQPSVNFRNRCSKTPNCKRLANHFLTE